MSEKEKIKDFIKLKNIQEFTDEDGIKYDYLVNEDGEYFYPVSPLEFKIIAKLHELEEELEELKQVVYLDGE